MNGRSADIISAPSKKWYEEFPKSPGPEDPKKTEVEILELKAEAKRHLEAETAAYQLKKSKIKDSEYDWLKTASQRGTMKDKVAASILLIQENPKYNLPRLIALVAQVKSLFKVFKQGEQERASKKQSLINDVRDLFLEDLLHPEFKLLKFEEQKLDELPSANDFEAPKNQKFIPRSRLLSHWYFEDQLKDQYEKLLTSLSSVAADNIEANREKAVGVMTDLLISNPEQEQKILDFLVNKIGDPKSKVASKAVFCLNKLLLEHPNMKMVVLKQVEKLLFRSNVAQRAQYYAICLLSQFVLNKGDSEVATKLIDVYFAFFKACLKRGEPDSRMMAAILAGVNRAYRFADLETVKVHEHIDSVYKVVHVGSFNVALNALGLLHQVTTDNPSQENRFYTAFYKKLLDPQIGTVSKRAVFLNLLYRVMKSDKNTSRVYAFVKRVLQASMYFPACMACATLYTVSQLFKSRKDLRQMILKRPTVVKIEKEDPESSSAQEESPKGSESSQTKSRKGKSKKEKQEDHESDDDDDDVQHVENTIVLSNVVSTPVEPSNPDDKNDIIKIEEDTNPFYDPFSMNPLRSGAVKAPPVELTSLYSHFHPSVSLFSSKMIEGKAIDYTGDPLEDLTLIRFLDRYVFKNPKKLGAKKVSKTNDPLAVRGHYTPRGLRTLPVDSAAYLNEKEERIPVDELFLYRYLKRKNEARGVKEEEDVSDNASVNSEEFNELLDGMRGEDFEELDIAGDIGAQVKKGGLKKIEDDEDQDDDDEPEDAADNDEHNAFYNDDGESMDEDDLGEDSDLDLDELDDEDVSDMEFNDSDDESSPMKTKRSKKSKDDNPFQKSMKKKGMDNVFMSAEDFAEMLEEQGKSKHKSGGSNALSDTDGASAKQIDWEIGRHQKLSGKFGGNKRKFNNKNGFRAQKHVKKFKRKN
ncbi:CCAAT/enhancer-binding protein zeta [Diachasma alloeum]|uniref:CCAAT/enhancer-binding protein zeta n=1 Tax=Diachasma alloeum TaxID=454923 RepID=UPI0007381C64|nr:CCAAT/enhancer-binding protein zeta [Diachasma alloeum]